jgi:hypothetical protein
MNNCAACRQLASDKLTASQTQLAADEAAAVLGAGAVNCRYCLLYATELCRKGAAQRYGCAIGGTQVDANHHCLMSRRTSCVVDITSQTTSTIIDAFSSSNRAERESSRLLEQGPPTTMIAAAAATSTMLLIQMLPGSCS